MIRAGISEQLRSDTLSEEVGRSCDMGHVPQTERRASAKVLWVHFNMLEKEPAVQRG